MDVVQNAHWDRRCNFSAFSVVLGASSVAISYHQGSVFMSPVDSP